MDSLPNKLENKLAYRKANNSLRSLGTPSNLIDFSSNDYLGLSASETVFNRASQILKEYKLEKNGATGSRLLSGNSTLYEVTEIFIANFHHAPAALIFNSGYDANIGFFSSVPQRGDFIFYDELCHASIRDGIAMSHAKSHKFKHNDFSDLQKKFLAVNRNQQGAEIYVVTESVFSMDGDTPNLKELVDFCTANTIHLIVDEAHAVGIFGQKGEGIVRELGLEDSVFARIVTFGKGMGCHGAAILGGEELKGYLINFARSFIYSTALAPHSIATLKAAYEFISEENNQINSLKNNIAILQKNIERVGLTPRFILSHSAIHSCIIPGNIHVKAASEKLKEKGFDVKPILSPTVMKGQERLRICLHSFNTEEEIDALVEVLKVEAL